MSKHVVATVAEIPPGQRKLVTVRGRSIAVFNLGGEFFGLFNRCPHQGGPMCEGILTGLIESDEPGQFLCECQDVCCTRRLALRRSDYEVIRRSGGYLVSLECIADSEVLHRAEGHAAVAFRNSATEAETAPSPAESSRSESSRPTLAPAGPSRSALSQPALSQPERSRAAQLRSGLEPAVRPASRRGALRLVVSAGSAPGPARDSSSLSSRSWHRRSQSARVTALPEQMQAPPRLLPAS